MDINDYIDCILSKYDAEYDKKTKILTFNKPIPVNTFNCFKKASKELDISDIRVERKMSIFERKRMI